MTVVTAEGLQLQQVPAIARGVRLQWEEVPQNWVLLYPEGRVALNGSAAEIMRRVDGCATIATIISDLQQRFAEPDLYADVVAALSWAQDQGWIEVFDVS